MDWRRATTKNNFNPKRLPLLPWKGSHTQKMKSRFCDCIRVCPATLCSVSRDAECFSPAGHTYCIPPQAFLLNSYCCAWCWPPHPAGYTHVISLGINDLFVAAEAIERYAIGGAGYQDPVDFELVFKLVFKTDLVTGFPVLDDTGLPVPTFEPAVEVRPAQCVRQLDEGQDNIAYRKKFFSIPFRTHSTLCRYCTKNHMGILQ